MQQLNTVTGKEGKATEWGKKRKEKMVGDSDGKAQLYSASEAGKDRKMTFLAPRISGCLKLLKAMAFISAGINIGATQGKVTASSIIPAPAQCTQYQHAVRPSTSSRRR